MSASPFSLEQRQRLTCFWHALRCFQCLRRFLRFETQLDPQ